jgi:hypothetical protein
MIAGVCQFCQTLNELFLIRAVSAAKLEEIGRFEKRNRFLKSLGGGNMCERRNAAEWMVRTGKEPHSSRLAPSPLSEARNGGLGAD